MFGSAQKTFTCSHSVEEVTSWVQQIHQMQDENASSLLAGIYLSLEEQEGRHLTWACL